MIPREVNRLYHEGRLVPFIGAGGSMSVSWRENGAVCRGISWSELVDQAARFLGFDDPNLARVRGTDLQILEYFRIKNGGPTTLTNWLHTRMQPSDADLKSSSIHQALAQMQKCKLFYTTNYDDFLERALTALGVQTHVVADEHSIIHLDAKTQIVKFHGDFNHPGKMVLSESDYERRLRLESEMDLKLRSDVLGRAILFIGYSFKDPNIGYLFRLITDRFGPLPRSFGGKRAYIILPHPSDFELQLFNERNIEVIPAIGQNKTDAVAKLIQEISI
jgi:SIR2-like domain